MYIPHRRNLPGRYRSVHPSAPCRHDRVGGNDVRRVEVLARSWALLLGHVLSVSSAAASDKGPANEIALLSWKMELVVTIRAAPALRIWL